jgi:hypothetical protein
MMNIDDVMQPFRSYIIGLGQSKVIKASSNQLLCFSNGSNWHFDTIEVFWERQDLFTEYCEMLTSCRKPVAYTPTST